MPGIAMEITGRQGGDAYYPWQSAVYHPFTILCRVIPRAKFANVEAGK